MFSGSLAASRSPSEIASMRAAATTAHHRSQEVAMTHRELLFPEGAPEPLSRDHEADWVRRLGWNLWGEGGKVHECRSARVPSM